MSGTKVVAQKPHFTPKLENCRNCIVSPIGEFSASDNSPLEHDSELLKPSKDS